MPKQLEVHPLAEMLPPMNDAELQTLKESIEQHGQSDPIELFEGKILDGRNRYRACQDAGIEPKTTLFKGDYAAAIQRVYARAVHRNMSESQKAAAAINFLPHFEKLALARQQAGAPVREGMKGKSAHFAGSLFGVSTRYVELAKSLFEQDKKVFRQVFEGHLPLTRAKRQVMRSAKAKANKQAAKMIQLPGDAMSLFFGSCLDVIDKLPADSVDLCFTDPPYGIGQKYNGFDDRISKADLMKLLGACLRKLYRVMKEHASGYIMMRSDYAIELAQEIDRAGFHRQAMIVWYESFAQHNRQFWTNRYRVIFHFTKHAKRFTFNHDDQSIYIPSKRQLIKDKRAATGGMLPSNVWGVDTDAAVARLLDNARERISIPRGLEVPNQLPVALVERAILASSNPGDLVIDPFHGTGTTARAALKNGRRYIGIELDAEIGEHSKEWIKAYLSQQATAGATRNARPEAKRNSNAKRKP